MSSQLSTTEVPDCRFRNDPAGLVIKRPPGVAPRARPYLLGLDSACVFGGHLSAYLLEEDRIIQIPAHCRYVRFGG